MQNPQNRLFYKGFGYTERTKPLSPLNTFNRITNHYSQVNIREKNLYVNEGVKTPRGSFGNMQSEEWGGNSMRRMAQASKYPSYGQKVKTSPEHRAKIQGIGESADAILQKLEMRRSGSPRQRSSERLTSSSSKVDAQYFDFSSVNKLEKVANDLQERIKEAKRKLHSNLSKRSTLSAVEVCERQHKLSQQLSRSAMNVLNCGRLSLATQISHHYFLTDVVDGFLTMNETVTDHTEWMFRTANRKRITGQNIYKNKLGVKQLQQFDQNKKTLVFEVNSVLAYLQQTQENEVIKIRPFAQEMLQNLSNYYEIIAFTNKKEEEMEPIIRQLDPDGIIFSHIFYVDDCRETQYGQFVKDIQIMGREMNKILLIDSHPTSLFVHMNNSVPVFPYIGDLNDIGMKKLERYLMELWSQQNIVKANSKNLRLDLLLQCKTIEEYIQELKTLL